jgi:3-oxoacyl-[acyl-carrier protein] reductase
MADAAASRISVDLTGRVAFVTGASRGIGKAIAVALGKSGAKVACLARSVDKLNETVAEITAAGGTATAHACDVADGAAVQQTFDAIVEANGGRMDIVVNNAGVTKDGLLPKMTDDDWDSVIATNLRSVFLICRAATALMRKQRSGRIINISSVSGFRGNPGQANYSASKAGVLGLTRAVAREIGGRSVTVNAICPGFISTEMTAAMGEAMGDLIKKNIPVKRFGEADEIADAVLFLASDSASYITGQVLTVDGGLTA